MTEYIHCIDKLLNRLTVKQSITLLRLTLSVTYIWFGALKVLGISPVSELVGKMSLFIPKRQFVLLVGVWELVVGIALLFRLVFRITLLLYFLQIGGTFLVFVLHPRETFKNDSPLRLTMTGEFIIKNLVLFAAGIVIGTAERNTLEKP